MKQPRGLTVKNPWATLILSGQKTLEVRSWSSKHRGRLGIHVAAQDASQKKWSDGERACVAAALERCGGRLLPLGHLAGEVELVEICPMTAEDAFEGGSMTELEPSTNRPLFAWVLARPRLYPEPLPMKGRLGLWNCVLPEGGPPPAPRPEGRV